MFLFFKGMDFEGTKPTSNDSDWDGCAEEAEFVDFSCNNDAGSSSTENNIRRTGNENDFFEPPTPGMQSTINIIDKSQLGQGMNAYSFFRFAYINHRHY
jgi:hypothetical protein